MPPESELNRRIAFAQGSGLEGLEMGQLKVAKVLTLGSASLKARFRR